MGNPGSGYELEKSWERQCPKLAPSARPKGRFPRSGVDYAETLRDVRARDLFEDLGFVVWSGMSYSTHDGAEYVHSLWETRHAAKRNPSLLSS